jgi:hypothetical protein
VGKQQQLHGISHDPSAFHLAGHPFCPDGPDRAFFPGLLPLQERAAAGTAAEGSLAHAEVHSAGHVCHAGAFCEGHLLQQCGHGHGAPVPDAGHPAGHVPVESEAGTPAAGSGGCGAGHPGYGPDRHPGRGGCPGRFAGNLVLGHPGSLLAWPGTPCMRRNCSSATAAS